MAKPRKLSPDQEHAIVDRYAAGTTAYVLADEFDVSHTTILKVVRRNGGEVRPNGQPRVAVTAEQEIVARYLGGTRLSDLATAFQRNRRTVRRILMDAGVYHKPFVPIGRGHPRSQHRQYIIRPEWRKQVLAFREERRSMRG